MNSDDGTESLANSSWAWTNFLGTSPTSPFWFSPPVKARSWVPWPSRFADRQAPAVPILPIARQLGGNNSNVFDQRSRGQQFAGVGYELSPTS
jgi:hypothetical protein